MHATQCGTVLKQKEGREQSIRAENGRVIHKLLSYWNTAYKPHYNVAGRNINSKKHTRNESEIKTNNKKHFQLDKAISSRSLAVRNKKKNRANTY